MGLMTKMSRFKSLSLLLLAVALAGFLIACGSLIPADKQYTNKLAPDPFVAQLNSRVTKMIALDLKPGQKIAWMGLSRAGDYKYFQIDSVKVNGKTFKADTASSATVYNSFPPVANIAGLPEEEASTVYINVTYKAKKAHEDGKANDPFKAYLMIVMDERYGEKQGNILINLEGYVRGVCTDCRLPLDNYFRYEVIDNDQDENHHPDFGLFLCDSKALDVVDTVNNAPKDIPGFQLPEGLVPENDYRFDFINLTGEISIGSLNGETNLPREFIFYTSEKKPNHIIIDGTGLDSVGPSVPPFEIPVPGGQPVPFVDVILDSAVQVACPIDGDGAFTCSDTTESGVDLNAFGDLLQTDLVTLTTGKVTAESPDCGKFGTWEGSGVIDGKSEVTLIAYATIPLDQAEATVKKSNIQGGLIIGVIKLKPVAAEE